MVTDSRPSQGLQLWPSQVFPFASFHTKYPNFLVSINIHTSSDLFISVHTHHRTESDLSSPLSRPVKTPGVTGGEVYRRVRVYLFIISIQIWYPRLPGQKDCPPSQRPTWQDRAIYTRNSLTSWIRARSTLETSLALVYTFISAADLGIEERNSGNR